MRKKASILLLICLNVPILAGMLVLSIQKLMIRQGVRERMITGMDRDELVVFEFTQAEAEDLEWEHEREFEFAGTMYDVIYRETMDNRMRLWCWPDEAETVLNRNLERLASKILNEDERRKENKTRLLILIKSLFQPDMPAIEKPVFISGQTYPVLIDLLKDGLSGGPPSPPPRDI